MDMSCTICLLEQVFVQEQGTIYMLLCWIDIPVTAVTYVCKVQHYYILRISGARHVCVASSELRLYGHCSVFGGIKVWI